MEQRTKAHSHNYTLIEITHRNPPMGRLAIDSGVDHSYKIQDFQLSIEKIVLGILDKARVSLAIKPNPIITYEHKDRSAGEVSLRFYL